MAKQVNLTLRANCGCAKLSVKGAPVEVLTTAKQHVEETGHVVEIRGEGRAT